MGDNDVTGFGRTGSVTRGSGGIGGVTCRPLAGDGMAVALLYAGGATKSSPVGSGIRPARHRPEPPVPVRRSPPTPRRTRAVAAWRRTPLPLAAEAALAAGAALMFFAAVSLPLVALGGDAVALVLAVACGAVVVRTAYAGAGLYAWPLALAAILAFDFFYLKPFRTFGFPDHHHWSALGLYLGVTVLVCTVSARTHRRVKSLDRLHVALANRQDSLRRISRLVARESSPTEVFTAAAEEVARLTSLETAGVLRYEPDGTATVVAEWNLPDELHQDGRLLLDGDSVAARVLRTGSPARVDSYSDVSGPLGALCRVAGIRAAAGCPIVLGGRVWGALVAGTTAREPLPSGTENRIADFTELVATAISNARDRTDLLASRARIVAAADEARRRIERDLHDGIQQRLVALALDLRRIETMVPSDLGAVRDEVASAGDHAALAVEELREMARGIHPAILTDGGLGPALRMLARRSPVPVEVDVRAAGRLPDSVEVAGYYIVSEALTNAAKHADPSEVSVDVEQSDRLVTISVRDDGVGGADPSCGSGLSGMKDRVDALGGRIELISPPQRGTTLRVTLPMDRI